jgi:hypothetical protein
LSTCYRWRARGAINAFHIGGRCFVHADEVRRFINSRNGGRAN